MEMIKDKLNIGSLPSGLPIYIEKYVINSGRNGKTVYIQSGIHGGEITFWIQNKLFNYLKENINTGEVIFIPCANPIAWMQRNYFSTNGKFDLYMGKDFNRTFPGNENKSLSGRIANTLFKEACNSDFAIDLHTSRNSIPFTIFTKDDYRKYTEIMKIKYNYFFDVNKKPDYKSAFDIQLDKNYIDNITIECGSHDEYNEEKINLVFNGILRLLNSFNMIKYDEEKNIPKDLIYYDSTRKLYTDEAGFIKFNKKPGDRFYKNDLLYEIYISADLGKIKKIYVQENGIVIKISPTHIYWTGDEVMEYIKI